VKINEQSGMFCKTVEVEIVRGGFNCGSGVNGQSLNFTVENNPESVEILKKAMENGSEVKFQFHNEFKSLCRSDSASVFGDKIVVLGKDINTSPNSSTNPSNEGVRTELLKALQLNNEIIQKNYLN
jgi:hypothetical protein